MITEASLYSKFLGGFSKTVERPVLQNKLLKTLCALGKEYSVSLEVFFNSITTEWRNILHLTSENTDVINVIVGDGIPAIFLSPSGELILSALVNQNIRYYHGQPQLHKWIKIEIEQRYTDGKVGPPIVA